MEPTDGETSQRRRGPVAGQEISPEQQLAVLLRELKDDGLQLVRQETTLVKRRMRRHLPALQLAVGTLVAGAVFGIVGLLVLTAAAIAALALALPMWAAFLVIGAVFGTGSGTCLAAARAVLRKRIRQGTKASAVSTAAGGAQSTISEKASS